MDYEAVMRGWEKHKEWLAEYMKKKPCEKIYKEMREGIESFIEDYKKNTATNGI